MRRTLVLVAILGCGATAWADPSPEEARAAYARFTALDGVWRGRSTRGWTDETTFRTIAGGSAVLATSFDAHPGETMATLFTLNGDALELTHYCVAARRDRGALGDRGRDIEEPAVARAGGAAGAAGRGDGMSDWNIGDVAPPPEQEARIVARLRAAGLVRPSRATRVAAAVALFAAGLAAGWWVSRPPRVEADGPRYVLLLEGGDGGGDEGARVQAVIAWARAQRAAGVTLAGEKLADGGEVVSAAGVAPAPAELGGYFAVRARDDAEARRIAASHPIVGWGGRVVVRRIEELPARR